MKMSKRSRSCTRADRPKPKTWPGATKGPPMKISLPFQKFQTPEAMLEHLKTLKTDYVELTTRFATFEKERAKILELRERQKQENDELSKMLQQKSGQQSRLKALLQKRESESERDTFNDDNDDANPGDEEHFGDDDDTEHDAVEPSTDITLIELRDYQNSKEYRKLKKDVDFIQEILLQVYQEYKISRDAIDLTLNPFGYSERLELKDKYCGKVLRICARLSFLIDQHLEEMRKKIDHENFFRIQTDLYLFKDSQIKQYLVSIGLDKIDYRALNLSQYIGDFKGYPEEPGEDGACDPVTLRVRVGHRGIVLLENKYDNSTPNLGMSWIRDNDEDNEFRKDIQEGTPAYESKEEQKISSPAALSMHVDSEDTSGGQEKLKKKRFRVSRCRPSCKIL